MPPKGRLEGDSVLVPDEKEASTLYNKGAFGVPQSGGSLRLDLVEALYLVENNRLAVERMTPQDLLRHGAARGADFALRFTVYRDLRGRTFAVRASGVSDYNVYPRGAVPGKSASKYLVRCVSERDAFDAGAVVAEAERAAKHQKTLLLALVDEEGDLTYYEVATGDLRAKAPALPKARARAHLLADRVVVLDRADAERLFADGWFGRDVGLAHNLSLPEAVHLAEGGRLDVEGETAASLAAHARDVEPDFDLRLALYRHLRANGLVVKTGFKYGCHYRVYEGPPDEEHAPYLVHALAAGRTLPWAEIAGFVRLAHGVRKRLYFAVPRGDGFALVELARRKP